MAGWNQSADYFNDNGFMEAQAHINFSIVDSECQKQPAEILIGRRSVITFTEINHSDLIPEADRHSKLIESAFGNLSQRTKVLKPYLNFN